MAVAQAIVPGLLVLGKSLLGDNELADETYEMQQSECREVFKS